MKQSHANAPLEQDVRNRSNAITEKVSLNAESDGKANFPKDEKPEAYFSEYHHGFQEIINHINAEMNIGGKCFSMSRAKAAHEAGKRERENSMYLIRERMIALASQVKGAVFLPVWKKAVLIAVSFLLMLGDSLYARPFFEYMGMNFLESIILAVVVGIALGGITHFVVPRFVANAGGRRNKKIRTILAVCCLLVLFTFMGLGRAEFLAKENGTAADPPVVFMFTLISIILSSLSIYIGHYIFTAERNGTNDEALAARNELRRAKAELGVLEQKGIEADNAFRARADEAAEILNRGSSLISSVVHAAHAAYYRYAKINMMHRTDGMRPESFNSPYPFTFQTFVEPILKQEENKNYGTKLSGFIIGLCCLVYGCSPVAGVRETHAVTVLFDFSVPLHKKPAARDFIPYTGLDSNIWHGVRFTVGGIGNRDYMPSYVLDLPAENRLTGNIDARNARVDRFIKSLDSLLAAAAPGEAASLDHSIIYRTVARNALQLHDGPYARKNIFIYSDCMEYSSDGNWYSGKEWGLLTRSPDSIAGKLERAFPLPDSLNGLYIHFLYTPKDYGDNIRYRQCSGLYKSIFEKYGAKVRIQAKL